MECSNYLPALAKLKKKLFFFFCNNVHLTELDFKLSGTGRFPQSCIRYQNQGLLTLQRAPLSYSVPFIILSSCLKAVNLTLGNVIEILDSQTCQHISSTGIYCKALFSCNTGERWASYYHLMFIISIHPF